MSHALLLVLLCAGRITGTVAYSGPAVRPPKISRNDAACARELRDETVLLSSSGKALANVVVRVIAGAPPVEAPTAPVLVTQKDCVFEPRVQAAVRGQRVVLKNEDATLHTAHAFAGPDDKKTLFNVALPVAAKEIDRDPKDTLGLVRLKCDLHPWSRGYVVFNENRLFAVTDEEGRFELEVPPGAYTLEAWHEKLGTKLAEVKVEEGKTAEPQLSFR